MRPAGGILTLRIDSTGFLHPPRLSGDLEQRREKGEFDASGVGAESLRSPLVAISSDIDTADRGEATFGQGVLLKSRDEIRLALTGFLLRSDLGQLTDEGFMETDRFGLDDLGPRFAV